MILNVISGKGGTGKTLFCTTLADLLGSKGERVIVVDMDFAVRGLTSLLYYYLGETYSIIKSGKLSSYELIESPDFQYNEIRHNSNIGITKYRTFDVLPSVNRINSKIHLNPNISINEYKKRLNSLFDILKEKYDYNYIILDCRAGYDDLISSLHNMSDISICVQEEDEISNITTINLIRQLEDDNEKPIFNVVNKSRTVSDPFLIERNKNRNVNDLTFLGSIPFDMDVMTSFGEPYFWDRITKTMYFASVANIWNVLAQKLKLETVYFERMSPIPFKTFERRLGFVGMKDRIIIVFGLLIGVLGILIGLFGLSNLKELISYNFEQILSISLGVLGLSISFYTVIKTKIRK